MITEIEHKITAILNSKENLCNLSVITVIKEAMASGDIQ